VIAFNVDPDLPGLQTRQVVPDGPGPGMA
jgi:hypothetical protein